MFFRKSTKVKIDIKTPPAARANPELSAVSKTYFDSLERIENEWGIISNLKDFYNTRAIDFMALCVDGIKKYKALMRADKDFFPKTVPAYKRLVMLLETRKEYEAACDVCRDAILCAVPMEKQLARNITKAGRKPTPEERKLLGYPQ